MILWRKINRRLQDTTAGTPIFSLSDGLLLDIVTPIWTRYPAAVFRWGTCFRVQWHGYDSRASQSTLHWRHNDHDSVSNHQPHGCLLNRLFRRRSKKTSKLRVTGLCVGNWPGPVNSPHKGPVTRKMVPFDDVIMSGNWATTTAGDLVHRLYILRVWLMLLFGSDEWWRVGFLLQNSLSKHERN